MALLSLQVAAGADDAHETDTGIGFDSANSIVRLYAHIIALGRHNGGFRFQNVTINQGTNILRAWLIPYVPSSDLDDARFDILAEDVDDADDFDTTPDVTSRTRSGASVTWIESSLGVGWAVSPNIASVIQAVVDRALWANGNAMVILGDGWSDAVAAFEARSYDGDSSLACKLTIKTGAEAAPALTLRNDCQQRNVRFAPFL